MSASCCLRLLPFPHPHIAERQQARKDKNFARADEIRDELTAKGIILEDTREGVRWKRA